MLYRFFPLIALISCMFSCNSKEEMPRPDDAISVGREFIEASLKGNYNAAKRFLLPDSLNVMYFERMENFYQKMNEDEKSGYKSANIIINESEDVTDSVTIINYSNTFKREPSKIKVVKIAKEWWVDFKYSFSGNL